MSTSDASHMQPRSFHGTFQSINPFNKRLSFKAPVSLKPYNKETSFKTRTMKYTPQIPKTNTIKPRKKKSSPEVVRINPRSPLNEDQSNYTLLIVNLLVFHLILLSVFCTHCEVSIGFCKETSGSATVWS